MRYRRNAAVSETEIDDGVFLVEPQSQDIFYLDAVSGGLWRLLEEPQTIEQMQEVVRQAFPNEAPQKIDADVAAAIEEMLARRLVLAAG